MSSYQKNTVLLVEDNPKDEMLTLRALRKGGVTNPIQVVRDGAEALEYLFSTGEYAGRDIKISLLWFYWILNYPKWMGLRCCVLLEQMREPDRFR
jgi:two-component system, response regulator